MATTFALLLLASVGHAQQKLDIDPLELVRRAARNEITANDVEQYFLFRDNTEYKDHSVSKEVVRTKQGGLTTTLLINGRPLTAEERQKDNEKLEKFANDPAARRIPASILLTMKLRSIRVWRAI